MQQQLTRWQDLPDGPEKYQAYLCSREWAVKKQAVRERAQRTVNGKCERCLINQGTQTHHLTYVRKYNEELTDLQRVCAECHEFLSGKRELDPKDFGEFGGYLWCPVCGNGCSAIGPPIVTRGKNRGELRLTLNMVCEDSVHAWKLHIYCSNGMSWTYIRDISFNSEWH